MKKTRGFTLIELLVVIAIIGILASVVIASLNSARAKARDARRMSDIRSVQTALELYYNETGGYPSSGDAAFPGVLTAGLTPTFIGAIPSDPGSGVYRYYTNNLITGYAIQVQFENKPTCFYYGGSFTASGNFWSLPACN